MGDGTLPLAPGPPGSHTETGVLVQRFRLTVTDGPDAGATFQSAGDRTVIGTHATADWVLPDGTGSRFHCESARAEGKAILRDLGSRNGTTLDNVAILAAPLPNGATVTLGRTRIAFSLGVDMVKLPLSPRKSFGVLV